MALAININNKIPIYPIFYLLKGDYSFTVTGIRMQQMAFRRDTFPTRKASYQKQPSTQVVSRLIQKTAPNKRLIPSGNLDAAT